MKSAGKNAEGVVAGFGFVVELDALAGRAHITGYEAFSVVHYGVGE